MIPLPPQSPSARPQPHPLLRFDRPVLAAAYRRGHTAASRDRRLTQNQFMRKWSFDVAKLGKAKKGWTASFGTIYFPAAMAEQWGFDDGRAYKKDDGFRAWLGAIDPAKENFGERVKVFTRLYAWPRLNAFGDIAHQARKSDVENVRFAVLVENREPLDLAKEADRVSSGEGTYKTHSNRTRYETVYTAYGPGTVSYSESVTYGNPYFLADYTVDFFAYRADGSCAVPPTAKRLTLKVVRAEFEQSVDVDLGRFARLLPMVKSGGRATG